MRRSLDLTKEETKKSLNLKLPLLAQVIRNTSEPPNLVSLPNIVNQDIQKKIINDKRNDIEFYDIEIEKEIARRLVNMNQSPTKYRSVHNLVDSKAKKFFESRFYPPKYNPIEKKALRELRKQTGRLYLLSDIDSEMSKDLWRNQNISPALEEQDEISKVASLQDWQREKVKAFGSPRTAGTRKFTSHLTGSSNASLDTTESNTMKTLDLERENEEDPNLEDSMKDQSPSLNTLNIPDFQSLRTIVDLEERVARTPVRKYKLRIPIPEEKWTMPLVKGSKEVHPVPIRIAFSLKQADQIIQRKLAN